MTQTREEFDQYISENKLTWEQLQRVVRRANHAAEDLFDPELNTDPDTLGTSPWDREEKSMMRALKKLHLLRIPMHYDRRGQMYVVRQECEHVLFLEADERDLEKLNAEYFKYKKARKGSKEKEIANSEYAGLAKRMLDRGVAFYFSSISEKYEFIHDDGGKWLDNF